jgi:NDP-sugar pyrophosphorylase family protein
VSRIHKAGILAAGRGTRMRELTNDLPKPMIPVRGRPILDHIVSGIGDAGITKALLIVGYREDVMRNYFDGGVAHGVAVSYARQVGQDGTGRGVALAKAFAGDDGFVLSSGDILLDPRNYPLL